MKIYQELLRDIMYGAEKDDRTGTGTRSIFGRQARFNLEEGFPVLTVKEIHFKSVVHELLWFLNGETNVQYLKDNGVRIWNEWADEDGSLGPIYGSQWRYWVAYDRTGDHRHVDQIENVIEQIKTNPNSRRMIVSAWNVADLPDETKSPQENVKNGKMALAPCHAFFQFYVSDGKLSCQIYCRSQDVVLGTPFNWASYALLTHMVAQQCDLKVGDLIWTGGDCHIYKNHFDAVMVMISRDPYPLPKLVIKRKPGSIFEYKYEDFELVDYQRHSPVKAKIAV